jgi:uncharacterized protein (TIGR03118 family)
MVGQIPGAAHFAALLNEVCMLKLSFLLRRTSAVTLPGLLVAFLTLPALAQHFTRTDLTVNQGISQTGTSLDGNLRNPWGLSRSVGSTWWISDNATGLSTLYDALGVPQSLVVTIPKISDTTASATPTGTVFNYSNGFALAPGKNAIFMFVTEDGSISGWNPGVKPTEAVIAFPRSKPSSNPAVYKGCTLVTTAQGTFLYVANFGESRVEVFDSSFHPVRSTVRRFRNPQIPRGYAPFNVQNVGGNVVVTYAQKEDGSKDEQHGAGKGFVAVFDPAGNLLLNLQHGSFLNAPWGVVQAPSDFGVFSHRLLIGNQGDGKINAFNTVSGRFEGQVLDTNGAPMAIDGLWALSFGSNATSGSAVEMFFTAGPHDEEDGLFGKILPVAGEQRGNNE